MMSLKKQASNLLKIASKFELSSCGVSNGDDIEDFIASTKNYNDKPNLLLFASFEPGFDFITQNSAYLKEHFNLFKIFTNTVMQDAQTENFKAVVSIKRDFVALEKILKDANYDISVIANIGLYYHWYAPFFKLHSGKPIVCIDKDMTTSVHCADLEILRHNFDGSAERAAFERDCEEFMIDYCDGLITNLGGDFFKETVEKRVKNSLFYIPLRSRENYKYELREIDFNNIRLCHAGTMLPISHVGEFRSDGVLHEMFLELATKEISLDLYPAGDSEQLVCYSRLKQNITLKQNLTILELLKVIKNYDFGMVLNDFRRVSAPLVIQTKYLFPTKIFTYLSAGLPIIINKEYEAANEFLLSSGVAIAVGLDQLGELDTIIKNCDYKTMKKNVAKFQENYSLQTKQEDLGNFLLKCIS